MLWEKVYTTTPYIDTETNLGTTDAPLLVRLKFSIHSLGSFLGLIKKFEMNQQQLNPRDVEESAFTLGYLEQAGVIDCAQSNAVCLWWLEERQGQESLTEFLVRAKILTPAAITLLDLAQDGYIRDVPASVILSDGAQAMLAEVVSKQQDRQANAGQRIPTTPEEDTLTTTGRAPSATDTLIPSRLPLPQIGSMLGKCLLTAKLGCGAFGVVYRALHTKLNIPVAVKVLRMECAKLDSIARREMLQEAQMLARITHHRIVRVLDFDDEGEWPYLILEFVDGISLAELIDQAGALQPEKAIALAIQACEGLEVAHQANIIHRDIKPANMLMTREGQLRLADLGLATVGRTLNNRRMVGTPHYVAPEQAMGYSNSDHRVDIYSLGASLYEMLTGRVPFTGPTPWDVVIQHVDNPPVPVHRINPAIPPQVWEVLATMLAKQPEDRYQSATQAKAALQALQASLAEQPSAVPDDVDSVQRDERSVAPKSGGWWRRMFRHSK